MNRKNFLKQTLVAMTILSSLTAGSIAQAQTTISRDYVNGYLFQLAFPTVADAKVQGLWENAPTQATDLTGVSWSN